jgi:F0F1-type ATP synthase membrane subunit c/vacuolar-type H+-ATPase subunit K
MKKMWFFCWAGVFFLLVVTYLVQGYIAAQKVGIIPNFAPTETQQSLISFVLVVTVMILGIVSSHIFEKAKNASDGKINLKMVLKSMMSDARFIMALVITPFIYNSIYLVIGNNPDSISDYLLAFQNGFFWEAIFEGVFKVQKEESSQQ